MKYRFQVSERNQNNPSLLPIKRTRRFRLKGAATLRTVQAEKIRLASLFEIGELPEGEPVPKPKKQRKPRIKREKKHFLRRTWASLSARASTISAHLRKRLTKKRQNTLPIFAGALCAALLLTVLASGSVLFHLFGGYHSHYDAWIVPNFVGEDPAAVLQRESEEHGEELPWNFIIQYADHDEIASGRVISQSPAAGVTRRIYRNTEFCNITLTVSRGRPSYELPDLTGKSERDARLALSNHGIAITVHETENESTPKGTVLGTIPSAGTLLRKGDGVVLQISKGASFSTVAVPSLLGLTEAQASTLLRAKGLAVGKVSYASSSRPAGTVIGQAPTASDEVREGTAVSYTVSLGQNSLRTVPNLCGLSYADAVARLREVGLVVGSLYSLPSAAPRGTVIEQSPPAGTPITSSTVSVDLYLSN